MNPKRKSWTSKNAHALGVGAVWLLLTLLFEFGIGRLAQHKSWEELLGAYAFERGNLWPLVLVVILLSPALVRRIRASHAVTAASDD